MNTGWHVCHLYSIAFKYLIKCADKLYKEKEENLWQSQHIHTTAFFKKNMPPHSYAQFQGIIHNS